MQLTDSEKRWLAEEFCGAEVIQDYCLLYCFPDGTQVQTQDFDPLNNWNHMWLVLEALVNRYGNVSLKLWKSTCEDKLVCGIVVADIECMSEPFPEIIASVALELRKRNE